MDFTSHLPCIRTSYYPQPHNQPQEMSSIEKSFCSHRTNGSTNPDCGCQNCGCQKSFFPSKVLFFSPLRGNTVPDRLKKLEFGPKMHPHRAQYEIYHKWGYAEADRKWPPRIYRACGPPTGPPDPTQPLPPLPLAQCCVELARSRAFPT